MNIEEIRKVMTREEFMEILKETNNFEKEFERFPNIGCPEHLNLKDSLECGGNVNCKQCWLNAIKNVKFKGEGEMRKDYNREYSIQEVYEFEEGTEFKIIFQDGESESDFEIYITQYGSKCLRWCYSKEPLLPTNKAISSKFKLKRKEYTFAEAWEAYKKGKEIESIVTGEIYKKKDNGVAYIKRELDANGWYPVVRMDIEAIDGKWYINN